MNHIEVESSHLDVLLVEDSPGDVRLTKEVFRDTNIDIHLHVAWDGVEAMAFLRREGKHVNAPRPDLILLDLNLPKMDGRVVLANIKADANLKSIPTVILTTSESEVDIAKSYRLQANCYLSKPVQLEAVENLVKCISDAEKHLLDHVVDIIVLDLGLPDAQGVSAVRRTHAAAPHTPLIVL